MPNEILVDSGPLIALFDRDDKFHSKIKEFIKNGNFKLITSSAVITEVCHILDFNVNVQIHLLEWILAEGLVIHEINQEDIGRILELIRKYSDRPMDFADATLVVIAEKMSIRKIISIDSDFDIYRLPGKVRIENVFNN